ncbi:MAG TPA: type VI secretion system tip protein TssI/VgrG, partial [Smithellaceae bacterium]|nr:type VI secretion system tip protein TssI/VgrG [Smithellaceae bacterium]
PVRVTPKPFVRGAQTAIVVGPSGEEIYPDKYGRVKVQFHWDREGAKDDKSSCWIRVSQLFAGAGWGAMFIPRIGHEVVVDFLEGDPDRPIITGRVYHGANNPPYPLPDEKTKSTIKTNSSPGGGGFNELRFEDKKGKEEIYLQGEKDWNILIKNNKGQTIGVDDQLSVGNNQRITVGVNKAETIGAAKELTIGGAYQVSVGGAMNESVGGLKAEEIGAHKAVKVAKDSTEDIGGNQTVNVGKDMSETISGKKTVQVSKDFSETVEGKKTVAITKEYGLNAKKILLTADDEITIKTGSAKIIMKKNGDITIEGKKINIKGSGDVVLKGQKVTQN